MRGLRSDSRGGSARLFWLFCCLVVLSVVLSPPLLAEAPEFVSEEQDGSESTEPLPEGEVPTPAGEGVDSPEPPSFRIPSAEERAGVDTTVFDLYLGDKFSGSLIASYTDDWFEIEDPQDAVSQLTEIKGKTAELEQLMTGPIYKTRTVEGVGSIYYDLSTFRVVLLPDGSIMKGRSIGLGQSRVGEPESGLSTHQTLGLATFFDDTVENSNAFTHRGLLSYGDIFLRTNGFTADNQPYQLNEATLGTILGDYQARGGLLQMRGQSFTPSLRFAGVQLETADFLFLDDDAARGSRLEIFVPSRSTVRFYRAGQLLAVQVLDFGLQEVDTSSFPQGSYDIEILISDSSGREIREQRFFTKAGYLASRARPVLFFSAGAVRDAVDVLDTPLGQAGFRMRASDFFDVEAGVAATDDDTIANVGMTGLYDSARLGLQGAASPNGDYAGTASLGLTLFGVSVSGSTTYADGQAQAAAQQTPLPSVPNFVPQITSPPVELVIQSQRAHTLFVSKSVGPFDLRYNIQRNKFADEETRLAQGPSVDWRILTEQEHQLRARLSDFDTEDERARSAQLFYRYRLSQWWAFDAQIFQRWQKLNDEVLALIGASYTSQLQSSGTGVRSQLTEELRQAENNGETVKTATTSLISDVTTDSALVRAFMRDVRPDEGAAQSTFGANAETTLFVSSMGSVDIARPAQNECVFVAEVEGNLLSEDDEFDVIVNGQRQGVVSLRERAIISLTPYRTYNISISASERTGLVDYDSASYEVTLFPGNVAKRLWRVDKVFVLIGRLVDVEGNPIDRERIKGAKGYGFTEEDGTFQLEVTGVEELMIESKRRKCRLDIEFPSTPEYYFDAGDVVCVPLDAPES